MGVGGQALFILLHVLTHALKGLFFPHWMVLVALLEISWPQMFEFISGLCFIV